ncbi:MAG: hypothetical protein HC929_08710, partial [Leptolyngbyaceae cyanobacterium SM2_5_2]|nr:hypothetical protein [Leptolyngbyaceae cyanobacterium SM2_5_2]
MMKRLMFYCQHILGIGHLVRSMEIVRGLTDDFAVCFINGGEAIAEFDIPPGIEVLQLPPLKTDSEFTELQLPDGFATLDDLLPQAQAQAIQLGCTEVEPDHLLAGLWAEPTTAAAQILQAGGERPALSLPGQMATRESLGLSHQSKFVLEMALQIVRLRETKSIG